MFVKHLTEIGHANLRGICEYMPGYDVCDLIRLQGLKTCTPIEIEKLRNSWPCFLSSWVTFNPAAVVCNIVLLCIVYHGSVTRDQTIVFENGYSHKLLFVMLSVDHAG